MKYRITLQAEIIVEFDENSEEFKEMFDGYKQAIDRSADYESIAQTVADQVSRYGTRQHIEGLERQPCYCKTNVIASASFNELLTFK